MLFVTLVVSGTDAGLYRYRRRPHFCVIPRNGILPGSGKNVVICKLQFCYYLFLGEMQEPWKQAWRSLGAIL